MKKKLDTKTTCCVDYAFQRIGGKYKGRLIWYIHNSGGILRYGEAKRMVTGITPKMLTQTLRELEDDNLIKRKVYLEVPPKVEYSLTEAARRLIPFIEHLKQWGEEQMNKENSKVSSKKLAKGA
jgi:DNA-binding HxlR family transcriptional regulator